MSFPYSNPSRKRHYLPYIAALVVLLMVCWAAVLYVVWAIVEWAT